jgi:hypothetical protein
MPGLVGGAGWWLSPGERPPPLLSPVPSRVNPSGGKDQGRDGTGGLVVDFGFVAGAFEGLVKGPLGFGRVLVLFGMGGYGVDQLLG